MLTFSGLRATTGKPWTRINRVPLCLGYPVHRSYLLLEGTLPTPRLYTASGDTRGILSPAYHSISSPILPQSGVFAAWEK
jgi:hypothetical protein